MAEEASAAGLPELGKEVIDPAPLRVYTIHPRSEGPPAAPPFPHPRRSSTARARRPLEGPQQFEIARSRRFVWRAMEHESAGMEVGSSPVQQSIPCEIWADCVISKP